MKKQDWLDYFEAVNGRSPEPQEVEAALLAGEFNEEATTPVEQAPTQPVAAPQEVPVETQATVNPEPTQTVAQPVPPTEPTVAQQAQETGQFTGQQTQQTQQNAQFQQQYTQQGQPSGQQVYTVQVAVPSAFTIFVKQFWSWLVQSWKTPTLDIPTHKYNGLAAFGLLVLFTSLTITIPVIKSGYMTFSAFVSILIGFAFVFFAFILAGFIVKRLVYKEEKFTLRYSFEWFGRLLSLNLLFMAVAVLSVLIGIPSLALISTLLSYFVFAAASGYTLYHAENNSTLDLFYKYIIASILFGVTITVFFILGTTIAGDVLFSNLFGNFNSYLPPIGY